MAAHNVCRYFKFGYCKFIDKCRFLHVTELCANPSCEIKSCNLRHPKVCKFFRDFRRCKFSDWCLFKHTEDNNNFEDLNIREIMEKLEDLANKIDEKDIIINNLVEKIRNIEEKSREEQTHNEDVSDLNDFNSTFINPSVGFPCENCDFNAKSNGGLQTHIRAKHKEISENSENCENSENHLEPDIVVLDSVVVNSFKCKSCDLTFKNEIDLEKHSCLNHEETQHSIVESTCNECDISFGNKDDLEKHLSLKHKNDIETDNCEIKLEVFALVDIENDVLEARKNIIEKLSEQEEVSEVLKVYVSKMDTIMDVDNLRWNCVDIFLTPKGGCKKWKEIKFRKLIFSKCFLWESFESCDGDVNREEFNRKKEEKKLYELWSRGYLL